MITATAERTGLSEAEYLAFERNSKTKHEYFRSEVFAMAGASRAHNLIVTNIVAALHGLLRERPCEVYSSDMRVRVAETGLYTYPDIVVVCGEPRFADDELDTLLNPTIVFEVLSKATESCDRGKKFEHYRKLDSLMQYVLLSQSEVLIEQFVKQAGGRWLLNEFRAGEMLELQQIGDALAVDELYFKVLSKSAHQA